MSANDEDACFHVLFERMAGQIRARQESHGIVGVYVARDLLPAPDEDDDFYHADLIGLAVPLTIVAYFAHRNGSGLQNVVAQLMAARGGEATASSADQP